VKALFSQGKNIVAFDEVEAHNATALEGRYFSQMRKRFDCSGLSQSVNKYFHHACNAATKYIKENVILLYGMRRVANISRNFKITIPLEVNAN